MVSLMKKLLLGSVALAALAICGPAWAADMPRKAPAAPPAAAPAAPAVTWTGCYVGGNIGGGWALKDWANPSSNPENPGDRGTAALGGFVGGGQIGCDYQFSGSWVIGIQGMFDGASLKGDILDSFNPDFDLTNRVDWFATITGRLGYALIPTGLLYVKGGVRRDCSMSKAALLGSTTAMSFSNPACYSNVPTLPGPAGPPASALNTCSCPIGRRSSNTTTWDSGRRRSHSPLRAEVSARAGTSGRTSRRFSSASISVSISARHRLRWLRNIKVGNTLLNGLAMPKRLFGKHNQPEAPLFLAERRNKKSGSFFSLWLIKQPPSHSPRFAT